jgi:uncharacterized protein YdeI (YjbR/CyaY-like superfamily)
MPAPAVPRRFATADAFRSWLATHHASRTELLVACRKVQAPGPGITYSEALDEALCHGWIDGVRRRVDAAAFSVRFTPRQARSTWSRVNIRRVESLIEAGRMAGPGLAAYAARSAARTGRYSFERAALRLPPAYARILRADRQARAFFDAQAPWYRRTSVFWVMSAKQEATRLRRLETLVSCCRAGMPIGPLTRKPPKAGATAR